MQEMAKPLRVGIGGLGTIGKTVASRIDEGIPGIELSAVSARNEKRAKERIAHFTRPVPVVALEELAELADIVIECAPAAVFARVAEPAIKAGCIFVPLSVGALISQFHFVDQARESGARIIVPTGGLLGLDALRACAEGGIESVKLITRKPPAALVGAPFLTENAIDIDELKAPRKVFDGNVREAAKGFPANINVGAALSLAGIGPDRTQVEIWADPTIPRNTHRIQVEAVIIESVPSPDNPRTGRLTPLSVIATLRGLVETLKVGT